MPAHNPELWELQSDGVDVRDRSAGLAGAEGACVTDLRAEGNIELYAFDVEWPVVGLRRRQVPEPRHDPEALEAFAEDIVL